jgi:hypothetical protein
MNNKYSAKLEQRASEGAPLEKEGPRWRPCCAGGGSRAYKVESGAPEQHCCRWIRLVFPFHLALSAYRRCWSNG